MNLSAIFYLAGAILLFLVGFGVMDAMQDQVSIPWIALALVSTGLLLGASGRDRRIG